MLGCNHFCRCYYGVLPPLTLPNWIQWCGQWERRSSKLLVSVPVVRLRLRGSAIWNTVAIFSFGGSFGSDGRPRSSDIFREAYSGQEYDQNADSSVGELDQSGPCMRRSNKTRSSEQKS
jgi:hypothetical protein